MRSIASGEKCISCAYCIPHRSGHRGGSLDIDNYCTVSVFFEQAYLSRQGTPALYGVFRGLALIG
ncbi:hypothetical protein FQZ46_24425 [Escherichia coli]|nr:hypothetical protein [Escherichia coli]